jgi:hypothetical protein
LVLHLHLHELVSHEPIAHSLVLHHSVDLRSLTLGNASKYFVYFPLKLVLLATCLKISYRCGGASENRILETLLVEH